MGVVGLVTGEGLLFLTSLPRERLLDFPPGDTINSGLDNIEVMISSEVKYSCGGSLLGEGENNFVSILLNCCDDSFATPKNKQD